MHAPIGCMANESSNNLLNLSEKKTNFNFIVKLINDDIDDIQLLQKILKNLETVEYPQTIHELIKSITDHNASSCLSILHFIIKSGCCFNFLTSKDSALKTPSDYLLDSKISSFKIANIAPCLDGKKKPEEILEQIALCKLLLHIDHENNQEIILFENAAKMLIKYKKNATPFNALIYQTGKEPTPIMHYLVSLLTTPNFMKFFPLVYLVLKCNLDYATQKDSNGLPPFGALDKSQLSSPFAQYLLASFLKQYKNEAELKKNRDFIFLNACIYFNKFHMACDILKNYKENKKNFLLTLIIDNGRKQTTAHFILDSIETSTSFTNSSELLKLVLELEPKLLDMEDHDNLIPQQYVTKKMNQLSDEEKKQLLLTLKPKKQKEPNNFIYVVTKKLSGRLSKSLPTIKEN